MLMFIHVCLLMISLLFSAVFPLIQSLSLKICITFFLCYVKANDHNSTSLLFLGTHPKLMLCMPSSLSGQLQLTSFLELQWQPNTL